MGKGMTWTAEADAKLFLFVLSENNIKVDYKAAAKYLSRDGVIVTPSAVAKHISVLRVNMRDNDNSAQSTPTKSKSIARSNENSTKKRKASKQAHAEDDNDDDSGSEDQTTNRGNRPSESPTPAPKRQRHSRDSVTLGRESPRVVIDLEPPEVKSEEDEATIMASNDLV